MKQLPTSNNKDASSKELTKETLIINAIAKMNISALEILLDDSGIYHNTTKETFLEKLEDLFLTRKNNGDRHLKVYSGKCNADCNLCKNCGNKGYRFVGNKSNIYFDFIFKFYGQNNSNIFYCYYFETDETIEKLEYKTYVEINEDENVDFVKTPEYLLKMSAATTAFSEICSPKKGITAEQFIKWFHKHSDLYEEIGYDFFGPKMKWTPFLKLYSDLEETKNYLELYLPIIKKAYSQLSILKTEQNYIDWIIEYEDIYFNSPYYLKHGLKLKNGIIYCEANYNTTIIFDGNDFLETYLFLKSLLKYNIKLIKKYSIYDNKEFSYKDLDFCNKESTENVKSLKNHIKKREALAKLGIEIPYNQVFYYY